MKKVTARFIGQTSCGFVPDHVYELDIFTESRWVWVRDRHSPAKCPYESIGALGDNWEIPSKKPFRFAEVWELPASDRIWGD